MANRVLRARPCSTADLHPWKATLVEKVSQLHRACFEKRTALTYTIQGLPHPKGIDALAEITYATQIGYGLTYEEAHVRAQKILAARRLDFTETRPV